MTTAATRSGRLKVAAVLSVLVAIIGLVAYDLPNLFKGANASEDAYGLVLGSFASDILAFVAAYGTYRRQRWGVVLLIVVNVYWIVQAITTLLFSDKPGDTPFALVMLAIHLVTVWCCLQSVRSNDLTNQVERA
jgi:uncharacterized membrane protein (UPF0136 family)